MRFVREKGVSFDHTHLLTPYGWGAEDEHVVIEMPLVSGGVELAMRLAAAIILSHFLGYVGVCLANPVAWTGAAVMLVPAYLAELRRQQNNTHARVC